MSVAGVKRSRLALGVNEYRNLCAKVLHRDNWKCRCCKRRQGLVQHHVVFRSHGGDDCEENLITLCSGCHESIHRVNPRTGAMLIIMPPIEGEEIDANRDVRFFFANGWKPK